MLDRYAVAFILVLSSSAVVLDASAGDADPRYRNCVEQCQQTGCLGERCFSSCKFSSDGILDDHHSRQNMLGTLYALLTEGDCQSDCRYNCMVDREKERESLNYGAVKYHGKWPFKRIYGMQEPASVAFSILNLAMHFHGWMLFLSLLYKKLPIKVGRKARYDYASLWHAYGILSLNSWFWSAVFHSRDCELTEKLDYSSAVALVGYSLILAILRCFSIRNEATRVMIAAPLIAFVTTHILYLITFNLNYGWNMKVCVAMAVTQLTIWAIWGVVSGHPSRWKLLLVVFGGSLAMLLEVYDFPPHEGIFDAHAIWHATTVPLTYVWWSFIRDDAEFCVSKRIASSRNTKNSMPPKKSK